MEPAVSGAIETARLRLRSPVPGDAAAISRLMTAGISRWLANWPVPFSEEMAHQLIAEVTGLNDAQRGSFRVIERRGVAGAIGWLGMAVRQNAPQLADLGYWLGADHHRQGYIGEALPPFVADAADRLKLSTIEAGVQPENAASLAMLKRLGMTYLETRPFFSRARRREETTQFYGLDIRARSPSR